MQDQPRGESAFGSPFLPGHGGGREALLPLLGIFCLALSLRLLYFWQIQEIPFVEFPLGDAREYDQWAQRIAAGDWWGSEAFYQAPFYPYFLAILYRLFGHSLVLVHVLQMVLGAVACSLLYRATFILFGPVAALATGLLAALYAPAIYFDGIIGKANLGLVLMATMLLLLARFQRIPNSRDMLAAGGVVAILSLTRENALIFLLAIPLWLSFRFREESFATRFRWAMLFMASAGLILGLVATRNKLVGDAFVITTSQMGTNFYIGNNAGANGLYAPLIVGRQTPTFEASDAANLAESALGRPLTPAEVSTYWMTEGVDFVLEQPIEWWLLLMRKFAYTWNDFEISDTEDIYIYAEWSPLLGGLLSLFNFGMLAPLGLAGFVLAGPRRRDAWLLIFLAVVYSAAVALFMAFARFRFPLVPMLLPLAGLAIAGAIERLREGRLRELGVAIAILLVTGLLTNLSFFDRERMMAAGYSNLAGIMLNQRREAEAEPYLRRATDLAPESPETHFHWAVFYFRSERWDEAERHLREMLQIEELDFRAHRLLAAVLRGQGRHLEAADARRRAAALNPDLKGRHQPKRNRPEVVPRAGAGVQP